MWTTTPRTPRLNRQVTLPSHEIIIDLGLAYNVAWTTAVYLLASALRRQKPPRQSRPARLLRTRTECTQLQRTVAFWRIFVVSLFLNRSGTAVRFCIRNHILFRYSFPTLAVSGVGRGGNCDYGSLEAYTAAGCESACDPLAALSRHVGGLRSGHRQILSPPGLLAGVQ